LCTHHRYLHHKKGVPHLPVMFNEHRHLEFEASLKALCIPPLDLTKFDLLLCSSRFVLSTIEWCICIQVLKVLTIEEAKLVNRKPLPKVERLELGTTKCTSEKQACLWIIDCFELSGDLGLE